MDKEDAVYPCAVLHSVIQLHPTLYDPMDYSLPGTSVHGFSRREDWSGLPCPPPGGLPNPGIKQGYPALQVDSLPAELPEKPSISIHTIRCYSAFQMSDILPLATTWIKLHNIMKSEISRSQKDKNCMIPFHINGI